ncbi:MAG: hypothetical protein ACAH12_04815 [Methylophilaceae bacterium]|uniref:hypothetical protein n=1 Tax=Methylovorus sp. MM2 TaxID=1848038 RepID=UPI0013F4F445|nr:hypothetical protein [Methylovorus sp. MM2]
MRRIILFLTDTATFLAVGSAFFIPVIQHYAGSLEAGYSQHATHHRVVISQKSA